MKCHDREKLFAYAQGLLEPREEGQVGAHVAQCAACRALAEEYKRLDAVLGEWKPIEPSGWFDARVRQALRRTEAERVPSSWSSVRWARWVAPALAGILVVVASVLLPRWRRPSAPPSSVGTPGPVKVVQAPAEAGNVDSGSVADSDESELNKSLPLLEDYDMLANFEVLSELPRGRKRVVN